MGARITQLRQRFASVQGRTAIITTGTVLLTAVLLLLLMGGGVAALFSDYPLRYKAAAGFVLIFLPQIFWAMLVVKQRP